MGTWYKYVNYRNKETGDQGKMETIIIKDVRPLSHDNIGPLSLNLDTITIKLEKDKLSLDIECDPSNNHGCCYEEPYNSPNVKILDDLSDICEYLWDDYFMIEFKDDPIKLIRADIDRFDDVTMEKVYTTGMNPMAISSFDELALHFNIFEIQGNDTVTQLHFRLQSENYNCSNDGVIIDVDGNNIFIFLNYYGDDDSSVIKIQNFCNYLSTTLGLHDYHSLQWIKGGKTLNLYFRPKTNTIQVNIKDFREHVIQLEKIFPGISLRNMYISHTILQS